MMKVKVRVMAKNGHGKREIGKVKWDGKKENFLRHKD